MLIPNILTFLVVLIILYFFIVIINESAKYVTKYVVKYIINYVNISGIIPNN